MGIFHRQPSEACGNIRGFTIELPVDISFPTVYFGEVLHITLHRPPPVGRSHSASEFWFVLHSALLLQLSTGTMYGHCRDRIFPCDRFAKFSGALRVGIGEHKKKHVDRANVVL